jgi:hypothetical protein
MLKVSPQRVEPQRVDTLTKEGWLSSVSTPFKDKI